MGPDNTARWVGENIPGNEHLVALNYEAEIEFSGDYEMAEGYMLTSSPSAPAVTEDIFWGFLDTPSEKYFTGNELRVTLITYTGDFTQTPLTDENFSGLVDAVQLEYYPAGVSTNFDTAVLVPPTDYEIVPEPGGILMALLGAFLAVGRFMWKGSDYA